jgi:transcriptional antiterminator RfaH
VTNSSDALISADLPDRALPWLVVRTKPRQERVAVCHLDQREVEAYCPLFLEPKWRRKSAGIPVPLFTSYIFVRCDPERQLNAVSYCPGVAHPVRFDRNLATVEQTVIDAIRRREGVRGYVMPPEVEIGIKLGSNVMIMAGPLSGMEGVFHGTLRGGERARVLVEFLRQKNLVEVDTDDLTVARA